MHACARAQRFALMIAPIILSQKDSHLLHAVLGQPASVPPMDRSRFQDLMRLLAAARPPGKKSMQSQAVGLYDAVTVNDMTAPGPFTCQIVLPHEADPGEDRFSVLAPISLALLGRASGTTVTFASPGGQRQLGILAIHKASASPVPQPIA